MIRGSSGHVVSMPPILETRKVSRYSTGTWGVKMAHHLERFFPRNNEVKAKISEAAISCFRSYRNAHSSIGFEAPEAESRRSNPVRTARRMTDSAAYGWLRASEHEQLKAK